MTDSNDRAMLVSAAQSWAKELREGTVDLSISADDAMTLSLLLDRLGYIAAGPEVLPIPGPPEQPECYVYFGHSEDAKRWAYNHSIDPYKLINGSFSIPRAMEKVRGRRGFIKVIWDDRPGAMDRLGMARLLRLIDQINTANGFNAQGYKL